MSYSTLEQLEAVDRHQVERKIVSPPFTIKIGELWRALSCAFSGFPRSKVVLIATITFEEV